MDGLSFITTQKWDYEVMQLTSFSLHTFKAEIDGGRSKEQFEAIIEQTREVEKWCRERFGDINNLPKEQVMAGHLCVVNLVHYAVSSVKLTETEHELRETNSLFTLSITMGDVNATEFKLIVDAEKGH